MKLKSQFLHVLRLEDTRRVRFSFDGASGTVSIGPDDFAKVAKAIADGTISVTDGSVEDGAAKYDTAQKGFFVGRGPRWSRLFDALIVHESVHAAHHLKKLRISVLDDETAGYIAMGFYLRNSGYSADRLYVTDLHRLGYEIAKSVAAEGKADVTWLKNLRDAIKENPYYSSSHGGDAGYANG